MTYLYMHVIYSYVANYFKNIGSGVCIHCIYAARGVESEHGRRTVASRPTRLQQVLPKGAWTTKKIGTTTVDHHRFRGPASRHLCQAEMVRAERGGFRRGGQNPEQRHCDTACDRMSAAWAISCDKWSAAWAVSSSAGQTICLLVDAAAPAAAASTLPYLVRSFA
jgi:hypothetical protein